MLPPENGKWKYAGSFYLQNEKDEPVVFYNKSYINTKDDKH
jgi:hypothetical protein